MYFMYNFSKRNKHFQKEMQHMMEVQVQSGDKIHAMKRLSCVSEIMSQAKDDSPGVDCETSLSTTDLSMRFPGR